MLDKGHARITLLFFHTLETHLSVCQLQHNGKYYPLAVSVATPFCRHSNTMRLSLTSITEEDPSVGWQIVVAISHPTAPGICTGKVTNSAEEERC